MFVRLPLSYVLAFVAVLLVLSGASLLQADSIASLRYRVELLEEEHMRILSGCE